LLQMESAVASAETFHAKDLVRNSSLSFYFEHGNNETLVHCKDSIQIYAVSCHSSQTGGTHMVLCLGKIYVLVHLRSVYLRISYKLNYLNYA
jgi:hypothetical protein